MHASSSFTEDFAAASPVTSVSFPAEGITDACSQPAASASASDSHSSSAPSASNPSNPSPCAPGGQHWALGVGRSALGVAALDSSSVSSALSPNSPCTSSAGNSKLETRNSEPVFPDSLPPVLSFITRELARASSTHVPLATSITLALASAAIGQGASFRDGERHICPNLYFLLLTESSPERDLLYRLALEPLAHAQEQAEQQAIHRTRVERRAHQLRLHAQRADLQTMNTTRRHKQARVDLYDDRHLDPEVSRLPFDSRLQAQREAAHSAAEAAFSSDIRDLARAEEEFDRQSAGDQAHYFSHIPRGRLLRRLLTHPRSFAYLNLDARHAASVFRTRLSSAAASDESALLAAHTRTPISCEPKIHGHGFASNPCATVLWSMPLSEWQSLHPDPATPLIPRFLILHTPSSCDEADSYSLSCSCSCSQNQASTDSSPNQSEPAPVAGSALDCGSPLPLCGVSQPAASGMAPGETSNDLHNPTPVACGTRTCTCTQNALADWHDTISQLLTWKSASAPREYPVSDEARALFHAYDRECRAKSRTSVSRPHDPDHARRLALLFHTIQDAAETAIPAPEVSASASASNSHSSSDTTPSQTLPCAPGAENWALGVDRPSGPDRSALDVAASDSSSSTSSPSQPSPCTSSANNSKPESSGARKPDEVSPQGGRGGDQQTRNPEQILPISAAMAAAAITLTRWFAQHHHPLLHPEDSDSDPLLDRVLNQLHRLGGRAPIGRFTARLNMTRTALLALVDCYPDHLPSIKTPKPPSAAKPNTSPSNPIPRPTIPRSK